MNRRARKNRESVLQDMLNQLNSGPRNVTAHARKRIRFRWRGDYDTLKALTRRIVDKDVHENKSKVIGVSQTSTYKTRYLVWFEPYWYPVIFDEANKKIVTVLPSDSVGKQPAPPPFSE